jgi:hypothetical protein
MAMHPGERAAGSNLLAFPDALHPLNGGCRCTKPKKACDDPAFMATPKPVLKIQRRLSERACAPK